MASTAAAQPQAVEKPCDLSLSEFLKRLDETMTKPFSPGTDPEPVRQLLQAIKYDEAEWSKFINVSNEHYTRNLVASKDFVYDAILLCWSPNQSSAIHDHASSGCWMRVLTGSVEERRYHRKFGKPLQCFAEGQFGSPGTFYIDNSIGLHSVHNNSSDTPCFSLHVYSPPITQCEVWQPTGCYKMFKTSLHSIFGTKLPQHFFKPSPFCPLGGKYWPLAAPAPPNDEEEVSDKSERFAKKIKTADTDVVHSINSSQL